MGLFRRVPDRARYGALGVLLLSQAAFATAPSFTGVPLTIPIPAPGGPSVIVNARAQGVISGSAPIQLDAGQGNIFINGVPNFDVNVAPVGPDAFGAVCLEVTRLSTTPLPPGVITVQLGGSNQIGEPLPGQFIQIVNAPAPTVADPNDPACGDPNGAPVVDIGANRAVADTDDLPGEMVTLTSTASDPEGDLLTYQWVVNGQPASTAASPSVQLNDGANNVSLTVLDEGGANITASIVITVALPAIPIANAGADRTIPDTDRQPGERVTLDGSLSNDPDGSLVRFEWFRRTGVESEEPLGTGVTLAANLPDGLNEIRLVVTNNLGTQISDTVNITVGVAPEISTLTELPNLSPLQMKTAQAVDRVCNDLFALDRAQAALTPDQRDLIARCDGLLINNSPANQIAALDELVADDFAVARTQTLLFANTQFASVMDRLIALRGGARGLSLAGLSIIVDGKLVPLAQLQEMAKGMLGGGASADEPGGLLSDKWGLWARGNYSFGEKDANSLSPSFDADQWALVGGVDYRFSDKAVGGLSLSYGDSGVEFAADDGALDTASWAVSLYGSVYAAKNFYFDGIVNVANSSYEARRNIVYNDGLGQVDVDASGDTDGLTLSGGVSGGYDFLVGGLTLSPNLGVFYIDATIDSFAEQGAGGLNLLYDEQNFKSLTGNLGFRATYAWNVRFGVLLPHLRVDYVREFEDDVDVFGVRFAADPNATSAPPILIETDNPDESYWRLAAGMSAQFKHGVSGYIEYQRLESFEFISFQDISLGLRFQRSF